MEPIVPTPLAAVFDLDGTLADTFPMIIAAWNEAVREPLNRAYTPEEVIARFGVPEWQMLARELPPEALDRAVEVFHEQYEATHDMVQPFEGVTEMLHAIADAGMPIGVMTGKGRRSCDITLRMLGWDHLFRSVVTGDEVKDQKPHPEGVLLAAREMGVDPSRCVFVGDSPPDILAGQAAGMTTIAAGWHTHYSDLLRAAGPDHWAEAPADVLALLGLM